MKAKGSIWNRITAALSSVLLLWILAPRHDCFCATDSHQTNSSAKQTCCQASKAKAQKAAKAEVAHDCCKKQAKQTASNCERKQDASSSSLDFQTVSCNCLPERAALREARKHGSPPEFVAREELSRLLTLLSPEAEDQRLGLRLAELHNDELKPSKIYLLNRALLN